MGAPHFRSEDVDGGRGGIGEVARCVGWGEGLGEEPGNTEAKEGLAFTRNEVGIVNRKAAGFDEGVDGRAGGTVKSSVCSRLVEPVCDLARDAAVGASYLVGFDIVEEPTAETVPEPPA